MFSFNSSSPSATQTHPRKRTKRGDGLGSGATVPPSSPKRESSSSENDVTFASIRFEPKPTDESDEDITPSSPIRTRSKRKVLDSDEEPSKLDHQNDSSDDECRQGVAVHWKAATQKTKRIIPDSDDELSNRKFKKRLVKGSRSSSDECAELDKSRKLLTWIV